LGEKIRKKFDELMGFMSWEKIKDKKKV